VVAVASAVLDPLASHAVQIAFRLALVLVTLYAWHRDARAWEVATVLLVLHGLATNAFYWRLDLSGLQWPGLAADALWWHFVITGLFLVFAAVFVGLLWRAQGTDVDRRWLVPVWVFALLAAALDITLFATMEKAAPRVVVSILLTWTVLPPLFFMAEWNAWRRKPISGAARNANEITEYQYGQELASKFWGGVVIVLALLAQVALEQK
jgi:hypothetical protein